ncbi:hypothetical protein F3Y22_tig00110419pilonHSYRG00115 [Hibiscus syriacus]|uniref:DUF4283 domain-containing protein n=1 Tax=Hibiscus syriacus TaxID=106335 RepID=A0A6A3AM05_HIBSY|nr:hypothetical protein F3Y22_tig00110419pilonHSYRG00115 [Hibiscus syriacus]
MKNSIEFLALPSKLEPSGNKGGRPPDDALAIAAQLTMERHGSPLAEANLRQACNDWAVEELKAFRMTTAVAGNVYGQSIVDSCNVTNPKGYPNKPSFCDMVVRGNADHKSSNSISELDVEVNPEDVVIGQDGVVPEIRFSDKVHAAIDAKLAQSVTLWCPSGDMNLIDLDNEYYPVRFAVKEDYLQVLFGRPWVIYGCYLTVQPWCRSFSTTADHPSKIMVWACLLGFPYRYYNKSLLRHITGLIGQVVCINYNTKDGSRGRFARLAIMVDLDKPLISGLKIDGCGQGIEYEGLPLICYACDKYVHTMEHCSRGKQTTVEETLDNYTINHSENPYGLLLINRAK